jgi:transcriptional regulator
MYIPPVNAESRLEVMQALIRTHPLGTWTHFDGVDLITNHLPFLLDASRGPCGTLVGHVARANPVWRAAQSGVPSVISFQGPQAYVTPNWYPSKREHGKVVPTWNYAVVHARGTPPTSATTAKCCTRTSRT